MNGDVLTDMDYQRVLRRAPGSRARRRRSPRRRATIEVSLGVMRFERRRDPERVTDYIEKPTLVLRGVDGRLRVRPARAALHRARRAAGLPDLILRLLAAGEEVRAYRPRAYWLDLGRHEDYEQAMAEFEAMRDAADRPPELTRLDLLERRVGGEREREVALGGRLLGVRAGRVS